MRILGTVAVAVLVTCGVITVTGAGPESGWAGIFFGAASGVIAHRIGRVA